VAIWESLQGVYMRVRLLGPNTSHAIGENLIMTAITLSPPLGADPLGCHIHIYNRRNPVKRNKTNASASARLNKFNKWSVPYEQPHGGFGVWGNSTSTWLVSGGGKTCADTICSGPISLRKYTKLNPRKSSNPTPPVQSSSRLPRMLSVEIIN